MLLTTPRAAATAPAVVAAAAAVHEVEPGFVDELAAGLLDRVEGELLVALGGGRVLDTGKAVVAARGGSGRVAAIPTTLSGAEMTHVHRLPAGAPASTRHVRPAIVVSDPLLCASQPLPELAGSAGNALGHALEGPLTPWAGPVAPLTGGEAARLIATAMPPGDAGAVDRDRLALGALLAGYTIDVAGYGLHHVCSQTLVRFAGVGHGPANAIMLPHTLGALARRRPERLARLAAVAGEDLGALTRRVRDVTGVGRLSELGVTPDALDACADAAAGRPELAGTPPEADRAELRALYDAAF